MLRSRLPLAALLLAALSCTPEIRYGDRCERTSDCPAPYACILGRCREECTQARDCPLGALCVQQGSARVCTLPSDTCDADEDCAGTLVCDPSVRECRASCADGATCLEGSMCAARGERAICVASEEGRDAGVDESDGGVGPLPCTGPTLATFDRGLEGFCFEASRGLDPTAHARRVVEGGEASLRIDLAGAGERPWVRAQQSVPLDESVGHTFVLRDIDVAGGFLVIALEALEADGSVIARRALYAGPSEDGAICDLTGRPSDQCQRMDAIAQWSIFSGRELLSQSGVDLRRVVAIRRVIELIAGPDPGTAPRASLDLVYAELPFCTGAWYRNDAALLYETFDRPYTSLAPGLRWAGDPSAPILASFLGTCSTAAELNGERWLEWSGALPGSGAITVEVFWHPQRGRLPEANGVETILAQQDGDLEIGIRSRHVVATAGRCVDDPGRAALEVIDSRLIDSRDERAQELEVVFDRDHRRLCLAREGVPVGCDQTECALLPPGAGPVSIGAGAAGAQPFFGALDELRIREGDHVANPALRSGECHFDAVCGFERRLRDRGANECVESPACTTITACPPGEPCTPRMPVACVFDCGCDFLFADRNAAPGAGVERCVNPLQCSSPVANAECHAE